MRWADANIHPAYPIEHASWIWTDDWGARTQGMARFRVDFTIEASVETVLHVSADERFELMLDGRLIARGPDRSDLAHWAFSSYSITLEKGSHQLEALVSCWGAAAPVAQISYQPGFILAVEGLESLLNTGQGDWKGCRVGGISLGSGLAGVYHVVGPSFEIEGAEFFDSEPLLPVIIQRGGVQGNPHGIVANGHRFHPTGLPEQMFEWRWLPKPVAIISGDGESKWQSAVADSEWEELSQGFADKKVSVIPAHSKVACLFDLGDYYCGYSAWTLDGGDGASIRYDWAEALVEEPDAASVLKGNRDDWEHKFFRGFGDVYRADGKLRSFRSPWWRAGRYLRVVIETKAVPLCLNQLGFWETGYPFEPSYEIFCGDDALMRAVPLMERGLQVCAHEIFVDCPYFEQLSYVGDARLQALCWLSTNSDDRLVRREIELFNWSRAFNGLVAERYPSNPFQLSVTYAMIWVWMLRDYAWWRHDDHFVQQCLRGVRALVEEIRQFVGAEGLLKHLPGWSFIDWVDSWNEGVPPISAEGSTACFDLSWILCLQAAEMLERDYGETEYADLYSRLSQEHEVSVKRHYWNKDTRMIQDRPDVVGYSIHGQCLAVLAGVINPDEGNQALVSGLSNPDVAQSGYYFDFYLLEALSHCGLNGIFLERLNRMTQFMDQGLKTPPEKCDPTRSDCHAWSSHPLYFLRTIILGVTPAKARFDAVRVAPLAGLDGARRGVVPHPKGVIEVSLEVAGTHISGWIKLPEGIGGTFEWNGNSYPLLSGKTEVEGLLTSC